MAGKNIDSFSFIEPLGHDFPQTKIERYWASFWGPYSLQRERSIAYAYNSNMSFLPMRYTLKRFELDNTMPDDDWIISSFLALVRTEFSEKKQVLSNKWPGKVKRTISVSEDFLLSFAKSSDNAVTITEIQPRDNTPEAIAGSVYDLLCDPRIGDKKNKQNNDKQQFIDHLMSEVENRNRLLFVIPGFPFKDQNRFRVPFNSDTPDLAEISFMLRLYRLTQSIYQVHPFGADIVVLTDGDLYHSVFDVDKKDVDQYFKRMINYRNKLNLQATVSFISLKEMIDRSSEVRIAENMIEHIEQRLVAFLNNTHDENLQHSFAMLKQGMKWNYNSKRNNFDVDDATCWKILSSNYSDVEGAAKEAWLKFDEKASKMALHYAAVNLMLKRTNLIQHFFPEAIRGTVHPKPGQFALAGSAAYAWNGIAWSDEWPRNIDDIRVRPYMEIIDSKQLIEVVLEHTNEPLFYMGSDYCKNYIMAKRAFPLQPYMFSDILVKPFKETDIEKLAELGADDNYFSWERISQNRDYYERLMTFRIAHYNEHGFGVYGVWLGDELIGQAGLQVVNKEKDQIEWVIFLGQKYVGQKYGSTILSHIIALCKQNNMDTLYAIVRPDNSAGIALAKKFGGVLASKVKHYSENGIKFKIDLTRVV